MDTQARRHCHRFPTSSECANEEEVVTDNETLMGVSRYHLGKRNDRYTCPSSSLPRSYGSYPAPLLKHSVRLAEDVNCRTDAQASGTGILAIVRMCRRLPGPKWLSLGWLLHICLVLLLAFVEPSQAAFIGFKDCLSPNIINSNPKQLQFTPLFVWVSFSSSPSHDLDVTVYGNVAGQATEGTLPGPSDPQWNNPNITLGKIEDVSKSTNNATTLKGTFNVLDYTPYTLERTRFCNETIQGHCPIAPVFNNIS